MSAREKLLRVTAPYFVAGACWRLDGVWVCYRAAPIIRWMVGKSPVDVKAYLQRRRWQFEWL